MNEMQNIFEQVAQYWGWHVGNKVKQEIEAIVDAQNVDLQQLQSAIATIQSLLDADPGTDEFDVGQNIVTQLTDHLTRITNLESDVATLKGDENTVGSVAYAVKQERERAQAAEAALQASIDEIVSQGGQSSQELQDKIDALKAGAGLEDDGSYAPDDTTNYLGDATSLKDADKKLDAAIKSVADEVEAAAAQVDANEAAIQTLNGDENTEGSVRKIAKDYSEAAGAAALASAKQYADNTFVRIDHISGISAETLASMFRQAMDCGFNGAPIEDVLNATGDCAQANGTGNGDNSGDGAVL